MKKIFKMIKIYISIKSIEIIKIMEMIKKFKIMKIIMIVKIKQVNNNNDLHVLPLWRSVINWQDSLTISIHIHNYISCSGWNWSSYFLFQVVSFYYANGHGALETCRSMNCIENPQVNVPTIIFTINCFLRHGDTNTS